MDQVTTNKMSATAQQRTLSLYLLEMLGLCIFLIFFGPYFRSKFVEGSSTILINSLLVALIIYCYCFNRSYKLPKEAYGLIKPTWRGMFDSTWSALLFCALVLVIKYVCIHTFSELQQYPLIRFLNPGTTITDSDLILDILIYILFVPFQVYVFHLGFQAPMIKFLSIKHNKAVTLFFCTLLFACAHHVISIEFAIIVLLPALFWNWIFYKYRCLTTISISHILVGSILIFIIGINAFLDGIKILLTYLS